MTSLSQSNRSMLIEIEEYSIFIEHLKQKLYEENIENEFIAIFFLEFNNLTKFDEFLDFNNGHELEKKLITQLSVVLHDNELITKVNNNQYIIAKNIKTGENPKSYAKKILNTFSESIMINEQMFYIQVSIGISLHPLDGNSVHQLINASKNAMNKAKDNGFNYIELAQHDIIKSSQEKSLLLMQDLPVAMENGDIYFCYQLQYSTYHKAFIGAEMLARWEHPSLGYISPKIFIPIAEKSGMIAPLTVKALIEASKVFDILEDRGLSDFSLSINISPVFLTDSTFLSTVKFIIEQYNMTNKPLNFEITEEVILTLSDSLINTLDELKGLGINIELDDFGTGYTSLQHLVSLPLDTLKVDRSFISGIQGNIKKMTLLKTIIDMSYALDLNLIVEGVETSEESKAAQILGSTVIQGYFYSKPIKLDILINTL